MQAQNADILRKFIGFLLLLLSVKGYAQILPGDLTYRDSFPGVKSCLVRRMTVSEEDSGHTEKYSWQRYTYLPDGRKSGSFKFHRCGKDFYSDSTFDSIVYNKNGLVEKKIEYRRFFGEEENRTEEYSYDDRKRVRQIKESYSLRDRAHTQTFFYDEQGRLSALMDTTRLDTAMTRFYYSPGMRVVIYEPQRSYGVIDTTWYNENGDIAKHCLYLTAHRNGESDQSCWDSIIYIYDGRVLVRKEHYRINSSYLTIYEYDRRGQITTITKLDRMFEENDTTISRMTYDQHGNITESREVWADLEMVHYWQITYNEEGQPVHAEHHFYHNKSLMYTEVYDYTYTYY